MMMMMKVKHKRMKLSKLIFTFLITNWHILDKIISIYKHITVNGFD